MTKREEILFYKVNQKGILLKHVAEVGVYLPETSNIGAFARSGIKSTFVEPDPKSVSATKKYFADYVNVHIYPVAVFDRSGEVELVQRKASTYLKMLESSPAIINDGYKINDKDTFTVNAVTFDEIDDGSIDLLSIDIEGGEWFVIKHMQSRPVILSVETHGAMYINPYIDEINSWVKENNYVVWYVDSSDTVYVKKGLFEITLLDKMNISIKRMLLGYKKYKKTLKRKLKKLLKLG